MSKKTVFVGTRESTSLTAVVNLTALAQKHAAQRATPRQRKRPKPFMPIPDPPPLPDDAVIHDARLATLSPTEASLAAPQWIAFEAVPDNGQNIPADAHGAFTGVGAGFLVAVTNGDIRVQTADGAELLTVDLDDFFAALNTPDVPDAFDPKVIYNVSTNHFVVVACANHHSATSSLLIAICPSYNPTGDWKMFRIPIANPDPAAFVWLDYPSIGGGDYSVVVSLNVFDKDDTFVRSNVYTFNAYAITHLDLTLYHGLIEAPGIGNLVPATGSDIVPQHLLVQSSGDVAEVGNHLNIFLLKPRGAGPGPGDDTPPSLTFSHAVRVPGLSWDIKPPTANFAPQLGSAERIATNDHRIQNVFGNSFGFTCVQTVFLPAGGAATRSAVQVWHVGARIQDGRFVNAQACVRIDDPAGKIFYAYPSVAARSGIVCVGYSRFAADQYASAAFTLYQVRGWSDQGDLVYTNVISDTVFKAGEAPYFKTFAGTTNRWGDYSNTVYSPNPSLGMDGFYSIQMYAATPISGEDRWGTWWLKVVNITD